MVIKMGTQRPEQCDSFFQQQLHGRMLIYRHGHLISCVDTCADIAGSFDHRVASQGPLKSLFQDIPSFGLWYRQDWWAGRSPPWVYTKGTLHVDTFIFFSHQSIHRRQCTQVIPSHCVLLYRDEPAEDTGFLHCKDSRISSFTIQRAQCKTLVHIIGNSHLRKEVKS